MKSLREAGFFMHEDAHVWLVRLPPADMDVDRFHALLAEDEAVRASRFKFNRDRRSFGVSRAVLRLLLARYLCKPPAEIRFVYSELGKPVLAGEAQISFNLSHSGDMAIFAFIQDAEIGVDIEAIRPLDQMSSIARSFFCVAECAELMALPEPEQSLAFFRCWTRKESFVKALGGGLSVPLDRFQVTLRPSEPARLVHVSDDLGVSSDWTMRDVDTGTGYAAAVTIRGADRTPHLFRISNLEELW